MSCPLPATLTPDEDGLTPDTKLLMEKPPKYWGQLIRAFRTLNTYDLEKFTFVLGRDDNCDVVISRGVFKEQLIANVSKEHFRIERIDDLVYISDLSKNGTYLNGQLIGKGRRCILQNGDEIAISKRELRVYVFKSFQFPNQDFLPSELRRKYQVSTDLGHGAFGIVKLVYEKFTCQRFACKKIIKSQHSHGKLNSADSIKKEIEIMKQLEHPFIVSIKEVEETVMAFFIIMEYLEGGELTQLILSPRTLTEPQVKNLFYQIAIAVQYLHDLNIIHRDLKPENILLKNDTKDSNMIKISDFGLSKMLSQGSLMKTQCGTICYVAPEVLDPCAKTYGKNADVWSLGVILFYMFSQTLPFRAKTDTGVYKLILSGKYSMEDPLWTKISKPAKDLIRKILVRNPDHRLNIDEVVHHKWFGKELEIQIERMLYTNFQTRILEESSDEETFQESKRIKLSQESDGEKRNEDDEEEQESNVD